MRFGMIDHSGHPHPATPAARALCRANGGTGSIAKTGAKAPATKKAATRKKPKAVPVSRSAKADFALAVGKVKLEATRKKPVAVVNVDTGKSISREEAAERMFGTQVAQAKLKKAAPPTRVPLPKLGSSNSPTARNNTSSRDQISSNAGLEASMKSGIQGTPVPLSGGAIAETTKVRFADGRSGVRKKVETLPDDVLAEMPPFMRQTIQTPKMQQDAEELASMLGRMMGLRTPQVVREDETTSMQEFIDGQLGFSVGFNELNRITQTDQGLMIGLFDQIIGNADRHEGNWIVEGNGTIALIDHGLAWNFPTLINEQEPVRGVDEFARNFYRPGGDPEEDWDEELGDAEWKDNDVHPDDLDAIKGILNKLKPEFDKRGQEDWYYFSLGQVEALKKHAKGTKRRIP